MNMRDDLKAFVDNEVSEEERMRILKEAENNPVLQAELIELRQISRVIKEEAWQPQPVGLEKTLRALESAKAKRPWWLGPSFHWAVGAACTVMLIAIFAPILRRGQTSMTEAVAAQPDMQAYSMPETAAKQEFGQPEAAAPAPSFRAPIDGGAVPQAPGVPLAGGEAAPSVSLPPNEFKPGVDAGWRNRTGAAAGNLSAAPGSVQSGMEAQVANVDLEVDDVGKARSEAKNIAKDLNGYVVDGLKESTSNLDSSNLTLNVPSSNFDQAVNDVQMLGKVRSVKPVELENNASQNSFKPANATDAARKDARAPRKKVSSKETAKNATINLSLSERPKIGAEAKQKGHVSTASTPKPEIDVAGFFGLVFKWSPVWMTAILLAWWIARRRARG